MTREEIFGRIRGKLIVSCQALEDEPLHDSYIMSKMAYAAECGGAGGIRANSVEDIIQIKKRVSLPIIGLIKHTYPDSEVYITPTMEEIDKLYSCGVEIIAMDATNRIRPKGVLLEELFKKVRDRYPEQVFMADCSNLEDGIRAQRMGFDLAGTTLCGYTQETKNLQIPNYELIGKMTEKLHIPVIAEGGIWSPEQLKKVMEKRAFAAVIGTAITRPREITRKYVNVLK